jgi:hypothetical protein
MKTQLDIAATDKRSSSAKLSLLTCVPYEQDEKCQRQSDDPVYPQLGGYNPPIRSLVRSGGDMEETHAENGLSRRSVRQVNA